MITGDPRRDRPERPQRREAVHSRQAQVERHHVGLGAPQLLERLLARADADRSQPARAHERGEPLARARVVIDDQDSLTEASWEGLARLGGGGGAPEPRPREKPCDERANYTLGHNRPESEEVRTKLRTCVDAHH